MFICLLAFFLFRVLQIFNDSSFGCTLTTSTQGLKECFLLLLFFIAIFFPAFVFVWDSLRIRIIVGSSPSLAQTLLLSISGFGCYRSGGPTLKLMCSESQLPHMYHEGWRGCMANIWAGHHCHHLWLWAGHWGRTQLWSNMLNAAAY